MQEKILQYLYFRYAIRNQNFNWLYSCLPATPPVNQYTPYEAGILLDQVMDELLDQHLGNGYCVVPISGGWDSRILLGAAMDRLDTGQIKTVSFGVKGQLDYEIGALISHKMGVEHLEVDLSKVELRWDELLHSVQHAPWTFVPDAFYNEYSYSRVAGPNDLLLSGYLGGGLTGDHFPRAAKNEAAVNQYIGEHRYIKNIQLYQDGYSPADVLLKLMPTHTRDPGRTLYYMVRQANGIAPIVTPQNKWSSWGGYMGKLPSTNADVLAPFAHPDWAAYWLSAPAKALKEKKLYRKMMILKYPHLAKLPFKNGARPGSIHYKIIKTKKKIKSRISTIIQHGLNNHDQHRLIYNIERHISKNNQHRLDNIIQRAIINLMPQKKIPNSAKYNYLDLARAFREREDYKTLLNQALVYLRENNTTPWLDTNQLKIQHTTHQANHARSFTVLIGLALNIENDRRRK
ncbi:MAG: hypothetical protein WD037_11035 [Balneolales bacterium]